MDGIKKPQKGQVPFKNFGNCKRATMQMRWADGVVKCPHCDSERVTYLAKNRVWKCYGGHPMPKFSLKTGTIFEDSPLGLDKWLAALWLVVNCKNGISSCESARDLGVTQKTAWFMNHRLRAALNDGGFGKLAGEVEVDETFIGGKARNMHIATRKRRITGTGGKDKTIAVGFVQRGGENQKLLIQKPEKKKPPKKNNKRGGAGTGA